MPKQIQSISMDEAMKVMHEIIEMAKSDLGKPIAVAIVDASGRLKSFVAMDGVVPASIKLAQSKAYSAVIGQQDTVNWASMPKSPNTVDFDMRNWTDENFSGFTGGIVIKVSEEIIGGIGVSGRKGKQDGNDTLMQDSELACYGYQKLIDILN